MPAPPIAGPPGPGPAGPPGPAGLLDALAGRGETLATAESLTGGGVAHAITDVPGSSRVLVGAVVAYATRVKTDLLGVPEPVVAEDGVVSPACARAMAAGVRRLLGSTWGVATTGVAGPGPEGGVPAGTVYVGLAGPGVDRVVALVLDGDRAAVRSATVRAAVGALADELAGAAPGADGTIGPSGSVDPGPSGPEDLR